MKSVILVTLVTLILAFGFGAVSAEEVIYHSADTDESGAIELSELTRVIQFFNSDGFHCRQFYGGQLTEDGYAPGACSGDYFPEECQVACPLGQVRGDDGSRHDADYLDPQFHIGLSELIRMIQLFHFGSRWGGHVACLDEDTEDRFCHLGFDSDGEEVEGSLDGEPEGQDEGELEGEGFSEGDVEGQDEGEEGEPEGSSEAEEDCTLGLQPKITILNEQDIYTVGQTLRFKLEFGPCGENLVGYLSFPGVSFSLEGTAGMSTESSRLLDGESAGQMWPLFWIVVELDEFGFEIREKIVSVSIRVDPATK